jgi:hypothetical protein
MKALVCLLLAGAVAIFSTLPFASAQGPTNGMKRGFACTDEDEDTVVGHKVFRINLDEPGATVQMGTTNVDEELEGFFSIDNHATPGRANLFGVAETPGDTGSGTDSSLVDLTEAAVRTDGLGTEIGDTGIVFGTENGSAWDPTTGKVFSAYADDQTIAGPPQDFPATYLVVLNPTDATIVEDFEVHTGLHVDGLAVGHDGVLYATDARNTDTLYKYNFDDQLWEEIGPLSPTGAIAFNEDSGMGNYRGLLGDETNLYFITEGDGALLARLWRVNHLTGEATPVNGAAGNNNLTFSGGAEVPEDVEGFDIPRQLLAGE